MKNPKIFMDLFKLKIILLMLTLFAITFYSCGKDESKSGNETGEKDKVADEKKENTEGTSSGDMDLSDDFMISFKLEGAMNGDMTMYRSGKKLKQIINTEIMGTPSKNQVYIIDNFVFTVTEIKGKRMGVKTNIQDYNKKKQTAETITDPEEFESYLADKKIVGSENILGKNCDIYDTGNDTQLSIFDKMYVLRIKSPQFMATATEFETNPDFSSNEFEIPSDVNFRSINSDMKGMEQIDSIMNEAKKYVK
ncbi:MAG: hypothetical protein IPM38_04305 [Ignavibacteria bacterium]|nr:hypothetical protein [Ignavibacteria bacterium]